MAFEEPVDAYFADFQDEALHVASGQTIVGYLDVEQFSVTGDDLMPSLATEAETYWECPLARWKEVGVLPEEVLRIDGIDYLVEEQPRNRVVARLKLRLVHPYE